MYCERKTEVKKYQKKKTKRLNSFKWLSKYISHECVKGKCIWLQLKVEIGINRPMNRMNVTEELGMLVKPSPCELNSGKRSMYASHHVSFHRCVFIYSHIVSFIYSDIWVDFDCFRDCVYLVWYWYCMAHLLLFHIRIYSVTLVPSMKKKRIFGHFT